MTGQRTLPIHTGRHHDLPPRWDGMPVEWEGWTDQIDAFLCPPPTGRHVCSACGSTELPVHNRGKAPHLVRGWKALTVLRCPDCRHDQVIEERDWPEDDAVWELDETDYVDTGSFDRGGRR